MFILAKTNRTVAQAVREVPTTGSNAAVAAEDLMDHRDLEDTPGSVVRSLVGDRCPKEEEPLSRSRTKYRRAVKLHASEDHVPRTCSRTK
jgi:hypothetical protein